jgi:hypothetical protein
MASVILEASMSSPPEHEHKQKRKRKHKRSTFRRRSRNRKPGDAHTLKLLSAERQS